MWEVSKSQVFPQSSACRFGLAVLYVTWPTDPDAPQGTLVSDLPVTVHASWSPTVTGLARPLSASLPTGGAGLSVVPAPLERSSAPITTLRAGWNQLGFPTSLLLPRRILPSMLVRTDKWWDRVSAGSLSLRLDRRLRFRPYVAVLVVTSRLRNGPFCLDLPAHFLHPADRVRLGASRGWWRHQADIAAMATPATTIIVSPVAEGWLAVCISDTVAAELWALGLAEQWHGSDVEMQGPWEDPTVQRATELELGIRIPADMHFAADELEQVPAGARDLLVEIASRLGMPRLR